MSLPLGSPRGILRGCSISLEALLSPPRLAPIPQLPPSVEGLYAVATLGSDTSLTDTWPSGDLVEHLACGLGARYSVGDECRSERTQGHMEGKSPCALGAV